VNRGRRSALLQDLYRWLVVIWADEIGSVRSADEGADTFRLRNRSCVSRQGSVPEVLNSTSFTRARTEPAWCMQPLQRLHDGLLVGASSRGALSRVGGDHPVGGRRCSRRRPGYGRGFAFVLARSAQYWLLCGRRSASLKTVDLLGRDEFDDAALDGLAARAREGSSAATGTPTLRTG